MLALSAGAALASFVAATPASAATIIIYLDPMTMEQTPVVVARGGPDRTILCVRPPSTAGCQDVTPRRRRG